MHVSVALVGRTRLAALLHQLDQEARARDKGQNRQPAVDRRNRRTWRQLILGVVAARSTRLLAVGRGLRRSGGWAASRPQPWP